MGEIRDWFFDRIFPSFEHHAKPLFNESIGHHKHSNSIAKLTSQNRRLILKSSIYLISIKLLLQSKLTSEHKRQYFFFIQFLIEHHAKPLFNESIGHHKHSNSIAKLTSQNRRLILKSSIYLISIKLLLQSKLTSEHKRCSYVFSIQVIVT